MGVTIPMQLASIAGAYEAREREIEALQTALLKLILRDYGCHPTACPRFRAHPAPWHTEKCGCAEEARNLYRSEITKIEAKVFGPRQET